MNKEHYIIEKAGAIDNLKLRQAELTEPKANEVTIAIKAIGLNFADIFAIKGLYRAAPKHDFVPGLEYSGTIEKVGAGVTKFKKGDKVMGVTRFGAYTNYLNIEQEYIYPLPDSWSFEEGAAYLVQVLTAYYGLLKLGDLQRDATVLIHSAAGGVGIWANRIAKKYNAYTIGTVGSSSKVDFCKQEGYDKVIVRNEKHFKKQLKDSLAGKDLNLVMDSIGGSIFKDSFVQLASQGRVVVYGSARYTTYGSKVNMIKLLYQYLKRPKIDPQSMINYNKSIMGFNLIYLYEQASLMQTLVEQLQHMQLPKPEVGHTFTFKSLHDAVYLFQSGKTKGKVVLQV